MVSQTATEPCPSRPRRHRFAREPISTRVVTASAADVKFLAKWTDSRNEKSWNG
jgi:hypothetical protein